MPSTLAVMNDVTKILQQVEAGEPRAQEALFEAVYQELRRMAANQMAREQPGQTLQPTALVHEAWFRLMKVPLPQLTNPTITASLPEGVRGEQRRYFFASVAEAMRRILIERARKMKLPRAAITAEELLQPGNLRLETVLSVHEALDQLQVEDADVAQVVRLRFFAGLSMPEIAETLEVPLRTVERWWTYARSWLFQRLKDVE